MKAKRLFFRVQDLPVLRLRCCLLVHLHALLHPFEGFESLQSCVKTARATKV
jgi:hypothetical protein